MSDPPREDPPHGRGRPKAEEPGTSITAWIPASEYDRLAKLANDRNESLSTLVRQWLAKAR